MRQRRRGGNDRSQRTQTSSCRCGHNERACEGAGSLLSGKTEKCRAL